MSKPDLDQLAAEYCCSKSVTEKWNRRQRMDVLYGSQAAADAIRRAQVIRKLMGL